MKITMLSVKDYAGSGQKLCDAIKRHTDIDIDFYCQLPLKKYGHTGGKLIGKENRKDIQERIDTSDIIHIKGDWPAKNFYCGFHIGHKPIVQTVGGSFFRKVKYGGLGKYNPADYKLPVLKTAFTPDLCYPEYSGVWTPHPIDSENKPKLGYALGENIFLHCPTHRIRKNTTFFIELMNVMRERNKIDFEASIIENVSQAQVLSRIRSAKIFFDQFRVGFYGNAALEAMQYGIPTACWISKMAIEQAGGLLDGCPVITDLERNVTIWERMIYDVLENNYNDLSERTKKWCTEVHGYGAVAKMWTLLYQKLLTLS